ncbi:uncharacterized protein LOC115389912 [Salarias fasciatus]|uniref:uncharacterized protein LOC115389912 n=1 Tax=Salarias fasciatus TaxID=181472 RepID=UPI001176DEF0|nr:uncharacterized protein LOC115389912 [Salarias fasciatus]
MTGVSWLLLSAALLLLAGNSDSVDQNLLANIIQEIWTDYSPRRMFSTAVSIPRTNSGYDINQVLNRANGEDVKNTMKSGAVYKQGRIVAAMFQQKKGKTGQDIHAEYRVLQDINNLVNNNNIDFANDLLIFYVLGSPCYHRCTVPNGPDSIIPYLDAVKRWTNYAFVFTHVFKSKNPNLQTTDEQLETAVTNLGNALGLENIFRCKEDNNKKMVCNSCSQNQKVARYCISDEPDDVQNLPSSSRGRDRSPSQPRGGDRSPSQPRGGDKSPSQPRGGDSRSRDSSPSQRDPLINRSSPDVRSCSGQGEVRKSCCARICGALAACFRSCFGQQSPLYNKK